MGELIAAAAISTAIGVGSSLLINALTPAQTVKTGGLSDLSVPKSNYGVVIPQCWGNLKLAGNLMWATAKEEVTQTSTQGGKGGPRVRTETTSYLGSFAVMFAYCPFRSAEKLSRLWLNGQLVFDADSTDPDTISASAEFAANHMRFYTGAFDQPVDPLMQNAPPIQSYDYGLPHDPTERAAALTALGLPSNLNHISAYHYKCYAIIENLDLTPYGGQIPVVKAEILFNTDNSLETIVTDICTQSRINNIDTTGIANIFVPGFYLDRITKGKEALKTLQQAYFFDIIKSGRTYKFIRHEVDRDTISIPTSDLAAHQQGTNRPSTFQLPKPDPYDLPASVEISFIDKETSHEIGNVIARSQVARSTRKESYNFPLVMTADEAQQLAENLLHKFYLEAIKPPQLSLSPKYGDLEVGDRFNVRFYGETYTLQITKIQTGANRLLKVDTKVVEAASVNNVAVPNPILVSGGHNPPITGVTRIRTQGATTLEVMDINLIDDDDTDYGLYVSAYGGINWRECSLYASKDDSSYFFVDTLTRGTIGTLASPLNATSTSFQVALNSGELVSISDTDYDSGLNKILVGSEILQFRDRSLNGNNDELSTLRRGLRGTESFINSHVIGERVVLLTGRSAVVKRVPGELADLGQVRYFKAPSPGQTLAAASPVSLTVEGNALKPYSAVNLTATSNLADDILISWDRRDRHDGDATTYDNLILSEATEAYELEIYNGTTLVKAISLSSPEYVYDKSDQINDFGSVQTSLSVKLYQISADVGRGYEAGGTLAVTFNQPRPKVSRVLPKIIPYPRTITLEGSGFSDVIAVALGTGLTTNLTVISDTRLTCDVTSHLSLGEPEIRIFTSSNTYLADGVTPIDIDAPNDVVSRGLVNVIRRDAIVHKTGFFQGTTRTITASDLGKLIVCDTTNNDVTIIFDSSVLNNLFSNYDPFYGFDANTGNTILLGTEYSFNVSVQNGGTGKVIFQAATGDTLLARSFELINQFDTASWVYYGTNEWRGFGALY